MDVFAPGYRDVLVPVLASRALYLPIALRLVLAQ